MKKHIDIYVFFVYNVYEKKQKGDTKMSIGEIDLNKIKSEEVLDIYNRTKEFVEYLENEIKSNEVEKK